MADTIFESVYPLTIVSDRYSGCYSGGIFTAWNLDAHEVPMEIASDDVTCADFWCKNEILCGKGKTVEEAVANLYIQIENEKRL